MHKENDVRSLEKKNETTLQEILRQRAALQTFQQETARKDQAAQEAIAREQAKLQTERDGLEAERRQVQADELKNQASARQIAGKGRKSAACGQACNRSAAWRFKGRRQPAGGRRKNRMPRSSPA